MRFYGMHSGRNNPARFIARSYMRNSRHVNHHATNANTKSSSTDTGITLFIFLIIILVVACVKAVL